MISDSSIDHGKGFDWGRTSADYSKFRDIYPEEFYEKIVKLGLCVKGQNVLDIGTGTGVLPRNMYKYGAHFTGADISENQIAQARRMSEQAGIDIDYVVSPAEEISFPDESFDVITACQCFWYFDKSVLYPRVSKLLKSGGHFVALMMEWLPDESEICAESERLVLKYNPDWSGGGETRHKFVYPDFTTDFFEVENSEMYDIDVRFTRDSWNGRMKSCRGIGASLPQEKIAEFEAEHLAFLDTQPESFIIPHFAAILNLRKK